MTPRLTRLYYWTGLLQVAICMEKQRRLRTWLVNMINSNKVSRCLAMSHIHSPSMTAVDVIDGGISASSRCDVMVCRWRAWSGSTRKRIVSGSRGSTRAGTTGRRSTRRSSRSGVRFAQPTNQPYFIFWLRQLGCVARHVPVHLHCLSIEELICACVRSGRASRASSWRGETSPTSRCLRLACAVPSTRRPTLRKLPSFASTKASVPTASTGCSSQVSPYRVYRLLKSGARAYLTS